LDAKPFVLFDLGGTLVDLRGIVSSMAHRLQAIPVGGPFPLALQWAVGTAKLLPFAQGRKFRPEREIAADVLRVLLERRGRADARDLSMRLVVGAWADFEKICVFQPDASAEWLRGFRGSTSGIGLVSDGDTQAVAGVLARIGLSDFFDSVTVSEAVRAYKPNARIYRKALKTLRAKPRESLFVSDALLDLQGAATIGMAGAWISRGVLPELGTAPQSTAILSSLRDLDRIVSRFSRSGQFAST
jgi:2-haloalkanoic acid dehalogenase type II